MKKGKISRIRKKKLHMYIFFRNYLVLTKGADSHVVPLVTKGPIKEVEKNVTDFSLSGYRTLIICKRLLSAEQVFMKKFL